MRELAGLEYQPTHHVIIVNALQGLADVARHTDSREESVWRLNEAIDKAARDGYRLGEMRGLVSLGYHTMTVSAKAAAEQSHRRETVALHEHTWKPWGRQPEHCEVALVSAG